MLAAAGCVAAMGSLVAVQARQVETHPVRQAAEHGGAATLRVRVTGDPSPVRLGWGGPSQVLFTAELTGAELAGTRWDTGGRVVLLAPAERLVRRCCPGPGSPRPGCSPRRPGRI